MQGAVIDQAGLDLLLAHPHIVSITVLAIAATESRVDSPCSWKALNMPEAWDIRTVAYVPLHSLNRPVHVETLLLPPDVPAEQLPELLHAASTRMAEHRHLFSVAAGHCIEVTDYICDFDGIGLQLKWTEPQQDPFTQEECLSLLTSLEPLAQIPQMQGLVLAFNRPDEEEPARLQLGRQELEVLSGTWGSRLHALTLQGVKLEEGFFSVSTETVFPNLESLQLYSLEADRADMRAWYMVMCQRITRPFRLFLDDSEKE
jgi:hypothetical protein